MKRRALGPDRGLVARMVLASMLLCAGYGAMVVGLIALFRWIPSWWFYWAAVTAGLIAGIVAHYRSAERLLLASVGAELLPPERAPQIHALLARLAALAELSVPRLALVRTDAPNAFAIGLTERRSVVVVTSGLRKRLTAQELEAVIAHEVAHIANRDAVVMTATSVPRTVGTLLVGGEGPGIYLWWIVWPLGLPLWAFGTLLTLTISRYREYAADSGSALLTGAPEQLMSALQKLSAESERIPLEDLRQLAPVEALCIVPTGRRRFELLMDHPRSNDGSSDSPRSPAGSARLLGDLGREHPRPDDGKSARTGALCRRMRAIDSPHGEGGCCPVLLL